MAHKTRGTNNQTAQAKSSPTSSKVDIDETVQKTENLFQKTLVNQSHLNLQSPEKFDALSSQDYNQRMPKSSKGQMPREKITLHTKQINNIFDKQNNTNPNDNSDAFSQITKHSSSKTKIVLKPSQITKKNQPQIYTQSSSFKMKSQNNDILSPSLTQENLIPQTKFVNQNDYNQVIVDPQSLKARNNSSTPSPQKQKLSNHRINHDINNNSQNGQINIIKKQTPNNQKESIQQNSKQKPFEKQNDTFDYNWDDETINNSINPHTNANKASIKSKLMLSSIKNKSNIVTKLQDFQDEQKLQNSSKIDSVRRIVEENAQVSIWD
eukprot:403359995